VTKIIALNAPPRSGKDTLAKHVALYGWERRSLADPLKQLTKQIYKIDLTLEQLEIVKDNDQYQWIGMTWRQCLINVGEAIKDMRGGARDFWAESLLRQDLPDKVVIPDLGFVGEWCCILDHPKVDKSKLVHLNRPGCDWTGDSRREVRDSSAKCFDTTNLSDYPTIAIQLNQIINA
jgi:hypothetical protein